MLYNKSRKGHKNMENFEHPTNIKQIGNIEKSLRIYMEDYVATYLEQYAESGGYDEVLAMLLGKSITIDQVPVLYISGAILGKHVIEEEGMSVFTENSYEYIKEQKNLYFKDLEVVGWVQTQPGYGTFLNPNYKNYHLDNFKKPYQVMFVMDPLEKINAFYIQIDGLLKESEGYFIYYDKNERMYDYMLNNKILKIIPSKNTAKSHSYSEIFDDLEYKSTRFVKEEQIEEEQSPIISAFKRAKDISIKKEPSQKRAVSMMLTVSSLMALVSFVLVAGLMRSEDRINNLEEIVHSLARTAQNTAQEPEVQETFAPASVITLPNFDNEATVIVEDGSGQNQEADTQIVPVVATVEPEEPTNTQGQTSVQTTATYPPGASVGVLTSYVVQAGDNLLSISHRFFGSGDMVLAIMELNNITDPNTIFSGMVLQIPTP